MTRPIFARGLGTSPAGPAGPTGAAGPAGPGGANGGTDASTADNITNGTATKAALAAAIAASGGGQAASAGYDLVLLLGQSNMSGFSDAPDTRLDPTNDRVFQYPRAGTYTDQLVQAFEPLGFPDNPPGVGPGGNFGGWLATETPGRRRVMLIPAAYGGSRLATNATPLGWRRGVSGNLYAAALAQVAKALAIAPGSRVVAALWVQGEGDGDDNITGTAYGTDLDALITGLRTDLGVADLPFIIGQMVPEFLTVGTRAAINTVELATPTRLTRVGVAYAPFNRNKLDGNHFNAVAQRIIGRRMYDAYVRVVTGVTEPTPPAAPATVGTLTATAITDATLTLNWPSLANAGSFVVERKQGAGSYTVLGYTTTNTYAVTGMSGNTTYTFRVRAFGTSGYGNYSTAVDFTTATASIAPLLDTVGGAARGYSLRKLRTAYSGPAVRVRRSTDDAEQDIPFAGTALDASALTTFAAGGSAFVTTWYDQSGNTRHVTQAATTSQPRIVNAGTIEVDAGGLPAVRFDGSNDWLFDTAPGAYAAGAASFFMAHSLNVVSDVRVVCEGAAAVTPQYVPVYQPSGGSATGAFLYSNTALVLSATGAGNGYAGARRQVSTIDTGSVLKMRANGTEVTANYTRAGTFTLTRFAIGALPEGTAPTAGLISEVLVYYSDKTAEAGTIEGNEKAYYGTP